jgi:ligand-binding SRPBCC domain-containing protein
MTTIVLTTCISAPAEICFDLSRSIDLHQQTTSHTGERVIDGRKSGLIKKGEYVTWQAIHFFITQRLSVRIVAMDRPRYFTDVMIHGAFKSMRHQHVFEADGTGTQMKDHFEYEVPMGVFGKIFDRLVLRRYMTNLLMIRNNHIKAIAETENWKQFVV